MEMLSKKQKFLVIGGIIIICIIMIFYYINSTKEIYSPEEDYEVEIEEKEENKEDKKEEMIIIHITGAVKNQGIVEVKENARIDDVINAAGGLTEDADIENVNLAYAVEDGQKIYIPSKKEKEEIETKEGEKEENVVIENAGEKVLVEEEGKGEEGGKVNINTASIESLTKLPGIGSSTAQKIVSYRNEHGKFKSIEDIKNVSGIGEAKYNSIKDFIKL